MTYNLEWLKEEVYDLMPDHSEMYNYPDYETVLTVELLDKVLESINKIEDTKIPAIPKDVAEFIEDSIELGFEVGEAFENALTARRLITSPDKTMDYIEANQNTFAKAYVFGYIVKER